MTKKNSKSKRAGRKNMAGQRAIIPWNQNILMTDAFKLPKRVSSPYDVVQTLAPGTFTAATSTPVFYAYNLTLQNIPNYTGFAGVFDQYRIMGWEFIIEPEQSSVTSSTQNAGYLHSVIDYDDSTVLSSLGAAEEYDNCITTRGIDRHRRCFKPRIAMAAYGGSFTQFANNSGDEWIDVASTGVQYYGIKIACAQVSATLTFNTMQRAWLQFRCTR